MMHLDELIKVVRELELAHETVKEALKKDCPGVDPYRIKSTDGRYILLESLTQLVSARAVIAKAEVIRNVLE